MDCLTVFCHPLPNSDMQPNVGKGEKGTVIREIGNCNGRSLALLVCYSSMVPCSWTSEATIGLSQAPSLPIFYSTAFGHAACWGNYMDSISCLATTTGFPNIIVNTSTWSWYMSKTDSRWSGSNGSASLISKSNLL